MSPSASFEAIPKIQKRRKGASDADAIDDVMIALLKDPDRMTRIVAASVLSVEPGPRLRENRAQMEALFRLGIALEEDVAFVQALAPVVASIDIEKTHFTEALENMLNGDPGNFLVAASLAFIAQQVRSPQMAPILDAWVAHGGRTMRSLMAHEIGRAVEKEDPSGVYCPLLERLTRDADETTRTYARSGMERSRACHH